MPQGVCSAPPSHKTDGFVLIRVSFWPPLPSHSYVCVTKLPQPQVSGDAGDAQVFIAAFQLLGFPSKVWFLANLCLFPTGEWEFPTGVWLQDTQVRGGSLDTNQLFLRLQTDV